MHTIYMYINFYSGNVGTIQDWRQQTMNRNINKEYILKHLQLC